MFISAMCSNDNQRLLFCVFEGPISTTITFQPEEAQDAIRQMQKELSRLEKIAALQAIRDEADKALSEVSA